MKAPDRNPGVVLRDPLFVAGAVRLPRGPASGTTDSLLQPLEDPYTHVQAAAHAEGFQRGHEEGLRSGNAEGQRAGYEEGLRRGMEAAREETLRAVELAVQAARAPLEERSARMDSLLCEMADAARDAWNAADEDVLALCYETLCRVVGTAAIAPEAVRAQVEGLLATHDLQGRLTIHLHPADVQLLDEARAEGRLAETETRKLRWRADPRVALGGCMLAGTGGGIDARLETVLEQCKAGLLQARAARTADRDGPEAPQ